MLALFELNASICARPWKFVDHQWPTTPGVKALKGAARLRLSTPGLQSWPVHGRTRSSMRVRRPTCFLVHLGLLCQPLSSEAAAGSSLREALVLLHTTTTSFSFCSTSPPPLLPSTSMTSSLSFSLPKVPSSAPLNSSSVRALLDRVSSPGDADHRGGRGDGAAWLPCHACIQFILNRSTLRVQRPPRTWGQRASRSWW